MNHDFFSHNDAQFVLSYELLCLLQWLSHYEIDKLRKIIAKSVATGLHDEIQKIDNIEDPNSAQEAHHNIIDFFELLDELLTDAINDHVDKKAREIDLLSTIDQIDTTLCDTALVRSSVEKATKGAERNAHCSPKELLLKELLKQWKPHDKNIMN